MTHSISVVIPTHNYGKFIAAAIRSALEQSYPVKEIIVVDDGSTDETAEVVKTFGGKVIYIKQQNGGVSAARNRGVFETSGELIAFLDADDIWDATKIEKQVGEFVSNPSIGLVHCGIRKFDSETGKSISLQIEGKAGRIAEYLLLWEEPAINVSGSCLLVSREAFEAVNGFDPRIKCGEDWDFCYRVANRFSIGFVSEPLVNYRIHSAAAHKNVREMERGMKLFYEKAFAEANPKVMTLKNRAYGNFHRILAGSYFRSRNYGAFIKHAVGSIRHRPSSIRYFLEFPFRRLKR